MMSQDLLLHQVMSGIVKCFVGNRFFYIHPSSSIDKFEAELLYHNTMIESSFLEILSDNEMLQFMIDNNLWSNEEEIELNVLPSKIDSLKLEMYKKYSSFKSSQVDQVRKVLKRTKKKYEDLCNKRHLYDLYTQSGIAESVKLQYLLARNVRDENGKSINIEEMSMNVMSGLMNDYLKNKPKDTDLRALSRYGKWRMIWASGKNEGGIFGTPSSLLTDSQQSLIAWSKLYDNVNESMNAPSDEVIEDDDMLDGWIINEQNNRKNSPNIDSKYNKKGQEVYVVAETQEDADRVNRMNNRDGSFIKNQRMAVLQKSGVVNEENMPDSKQKMVIQANNQFKESFKGR